MLKPLGEHQMLAHQRHQTPAQLLAVAPPLPLGVRVQIEFAQIADVGQRKDASAKVQNVKDHHVQAAAHTEQVLNDEGHQVAAGSANVQRHCDVERQDPQVRAIGAADPVVGDDGEGCERE